MPGFAEGAAARGLAGGEAPSGSWARGTPYLPLPSSPRAWDVPPAWLLQGRQTSWHASAVFRAFCPTRKHHQARARQFFFRPSPSTSPPAASPLPLPRFSVPRSRLSSLVSVRRWLRGLLAHLCFCLSRGRLCVLPRLAVFSFPSPRAPLCAVPRVLLFPSVSPRRALRARLFSERSFLAWHVRQLASAPSALGFFPPATL